MKRFIFLSLIISIVLILGFYAGNERLFDEFLHPYFPWMVFFFFAQSFPVAWLLNQGAHKSDQFPIYVIGAITFRFLTALFLLLILFAFDIREINQLMLQFAGLYLAYLIFELIVVLANLRRN